MSVMIQEFASGYYIRTYWVEATSRSARDLAINSEEYSKLKDRIYNDAPIVFKIGQKHYSVQSDENVPAQTIEIRNEERDNLGLDRNPSKKEVLLVKPSLSGMFFG